MGSQFVSVVSSREVSFLHHFTDRETEAQSVELLAQVLMKSSHPGREASEDDGDVLNSKNDFHPCLQTWRGSEVPRKDGPLGDWSQSLTLPPPGCDECLMVPPLAGNSSD